MSAPFIPPINASTRYCAVLGRPVRHSASPVMHNAAIAALGLNWRYLAFEVPPGQLRDAIAGANAMRFIGLNLTVPHKLLAMDLVDVLDESARIFGAINTIRFEARDDAGAWRPLAEFGPEIPAEVRSQGFNTDADGIARSLREDLQLELRGAKVLVLGAGGAGRVVALKLAMEGVAELFLVNRTESKAKEVADEIHKHCPATNVRLGYPKTASHGAGAGRSAPLDLLVNATSLGLKPEDPLPLDENRFPLGWARSVYDAIYRPAETPLLKAAKAAGCRTANGLGMLLHQGARALEIWSGKTAPIGIMREALDREIYGRSAR